MKKTLLSPLFFCVCLILLISSSIFVNSASSTTLYQTSYLNSTIQTFQTSTKKYVCYAYNRTNIKILYIDPTTLNITDTISLNPAQCEWYAFYYEETINKILILGINKYPTGYEVLYVYDVATYNFTLLGTTSEAVGVNTMTVSSTHVALGSNKYVFALYGSYGDAFTRVIYVYYDGATLHAYWFGDNANPTDIPYSSAIKWDGDDIVMFLVLTDKHVGMFTFQISTHSVTQKLWGANIYGQIEPRYICPNNPYGTYKVNINPANIVTGTNYKISFNTIIKYYTGGVWHSSLVTWNGYATGIITSQVIYTLTGNLTCDDASFVPLTLIMPFLYDYWIDIVSQKAYLVNYWFSPFGQVNVTDITDTIPYAIISFSWITNLAQWYQTANDPTDQANIYVNPVQTQTATPIIPSGPPPSSQIGSSTELLMSVLVFFLFLFVPAMILAVRVGLIGFLAGLTIGALCLYLGNLMPLWGVFLIGLVDIMILLKGGGIRESGD